MEEIADWDDYGFLRPKDPYAAVIFVTGRKERFATHAQFMAYLNDHTYGVSDGKLTYNFADSQGTRISLGLFLEEPRIPTKNDEPINLSPPRVYDSPYIKSNAENTSVKVMFGDKHLLLE